MSLGAGGRLLGASAMMDVQVRWENIRESLQSMSYWSAKGDFGESRRPRGGLQPTERGSCHCCVRANRPLGMGSLGRQDPSVREVQVNPLDSASSSARAALGLFLCTIRIRGQISRYTDKLFPVSWGWQLVL